jgi:hypothetical protein
MHLGGVTLRELHHLRGNALVEGVSELLRKHKRIHISLVGGEPLYPDPPARRPHACGVNEDPSFAGGGFGGRMRSYVAGLRRIKENPRTELQDIRDCKSSSKVAVITSGMVPID